MKKPLDLLVSAGFCSSKAPFRDWAAEQVAQTDHPREVIEAALAHIVPAKVEAAYARSDLFGPVRTAAAAHGRLGAVSRRKTPAGRHVTAMTRRTAIAPSAGAAAPALFARLQPQL